MNNGIKNNIMVLNKAESEHLKVYLKQTIDVYGIKDISLANILKISGERQNKMMSDIKDIGDKLIDTQKECAKKISEQLNLLRKQNKELHEKNEVLIKTNSDLVFYIKAIFAWCFNRIGGKYKNNVFQDIKTTGVHPQTDELKNILREIEQEYLPKSIF